MVLGLIIGVVVGTIAGVAGAVVAGRGRGRAALASAQLAHERDRADWQAELVRAQSALDHERQAAATRQQSWDEAKHQLMGEFAELSRAALERNNTQFLELADERLARANQQASGDLDQRKQAIEQLLAPLREQLGRVESVTRTMELARQEAYTGLTEQVTFLSQAQDRLQTETRNLVTALRAPLTRGRWGEVQLRRVVELAGMVGHCDFEEQVTTDTDDGRVRPDLVVHLPGHKSVVVDAKVPLEAYLQANEADDEAERKTHLQSHARQLRNHVDALTKKAYWQQFERTPEFVVAFIPSESLLSAALENDPTLLEHAMSHRVTLATPMTLIALLRTVAATWQQEALADNAREVQRLGRELYKRLDTFRDHLAKTGRGLTSAVEAYNSAVGSLERSVLPQARRFDELGVGVGDRRLAELGEVDVTARRPEQPELPSPALELLSDDDERDATSA